MNWDFLSENYNAFFLRQSDNDKEICKVYKTHIPELYITEEYAKLNNFSNIEKTNFKQYREDDYNIGRKNLVKVNFKNKREANEIFRWHKKYLYGLNNHLCDFISQHYNDVDLKHSQSFMVLDIETTGDVDIDKEHRPFDYWKPEKALVGISLIQLLFVPKVGNPEIFIIGLRDIENKKFQVEGIECQYFLVKDELEMFKTYRKIMEETKPNIITGWNIDNYDIPYMVHRLYRLKMMKQNHIKRTDITDLESAGRDFAINAFFAYSPFIKDMEDINNSAKNDYLSMAEEYDVNIDRYIPFKAVGGYHGRSFIGYNIIDYLALYKKQTSNLADLPSYSLEYVSQYELGEGKVNYSEENTLKDLYEKNFEKFLQYGLKDVLLVKKLDDKMKFLNLAQSIAYICRTPLQYVQYNSIIINSLIYHNAKKAGMILKYFGDAISEEQKLASKAVGGFVHYTMNRWNWVSSLDFSSLYPSIISWANIGGDAFIPDDKLPDELKEIQQIAITYSKDDDVEDVQNKHFEFVKDKILNPYLMRQISDTLKKYDVCMTPNGKFFKRDKQAVFAYSEDELVKERKSVKKLYKQKEQEYEQGGRVDEQLRKEYTAYDTQQIALKVICNGGYGVLSMDKSQFAGNFIDYSNSVTSSGQCVDLICAFTASNIMSSIAHANNIRQPNKKNIPRLNHIATMDTDSFYLECEPFVKTYFQGLNTQQKCEKISAFIDKVIQPEIRETLDGVYSKFFNAMNPSKLALDREIIADKFISVGAKNYFCRIFDNERVILTKPKMKIKGLALVKTSMPDFFQDILSNDVLNAIIETSDKDETLKSIRHTLHEMIKSVPFEKLAKKMSVSSLDCNADEINVSIGNTLKRTTSEGKEVALAYNARASILHNQIIDALGLNFKKIEPGDKIMILNVDYKKEGCPIPYNYIAFKDPDFIKAANLSDYIDYELMMKDFFDKNIHLILEPLDEYVEIKKKTTKRKTSAIASRKRVTTKDTQKEETKPHSEMKLEIGISDRLKNYQKEIR